MRNPYEISHMSHIERPPLLENVTTIPCEIQILCIWSNFHCYLRIFDAFNTQLFHHGPSEILDKQKFRKLLKVSTV